MWLFKKIIPEGDFPGGILAGIMSDKHFEVIEHTADWSIRVKGHDLRQLFTHAAEGMSNLLVGELDALPQDVKKNLEFSAFDIESLLVEWLSELAYWAEMEQIVFGRFQIVELTQRTLHAVVYGGRAEELHKHIKAVTYHNLEVVENDDGWETTIVFDV